MFGEALLASQAKFCVEFHFEEPRKESGTISHKTPCYQLEQLSKEFSCDDGLRCCFWLLESTFWSHAGVSPVPCGFLSGKETCCHTKMKV